MIRFVCILLLFSFTKNISIGQIIQKEGLVNFMPAIDPDGIHRYTWFKDSVVIFEIYEEYSESFNDSEIAHGYRVKNYSILDLPTMQAQDYLNFTDTSKPVTNYLLKEDEFISCGFFTKNNFTAKYLDSLKEISDTVIDGNKLKRLSLIIPGNECSTEINYFLLPAKYKTIFHLSKEVDDRFRGYKVIYVQYKWSEFKSSSLSKLFILRNKLTKEEDKIFENWKLNLSTCTLPVTDKTSADKFLANHLSHLRRYSCY